MFAILTALTLATAPAPPPCCLRPATFTQLETSATEKSHRVGHIIAPSVMTTSFYGAALYFGADKDRARWIAAGLTFVAIVMKEVYDYNTEARSFSTLDVGLGLVGTAGGLWIAEAITWPEEQNRKR